MQSNDPQTPVSESNPTAHTIMAEDAGDGGFPIEGDGGLVDSGGQAHVPPPPPPEC